MRPLLVFFFFFGLEAGPTRSQRVLFVSRRGGPMRPQAYFFFEKNLTGEAGPARLQLVFLSFRGEELDAVTSFSPERSGGPRRLQLLFFS